MSLWPPPAFHSPTIASLSEPTQPAGDDGDCGLEEGQNRARRAGLDGEGRSTQHNPPCTVAPWCWPGPPRR